MISNPWTNSYPLSVPRELDSATYSTLVDLFNSSVETYPDNDALESFGVHRTYSQLGITAYDIAAWLQSQGLTKGDRVAIMSPNVMVYPAIIFGVLIAGGCVVNINPLYTPSELEYQINDSKPRFLFVFENFAHTVQAAGNMIQLEKIVVIRPGDWLGLKGKLVNFVSKYIQRNVPDYTLENSCSFGDVIKVGSKHKYVPIKVFPDDTAFLQYTGGTTGVSKGAVLSHKNVAANVHQTYLWFRESIVSNKPHCMVTALPLYHIFGLTACCMLMVKIGGSCLLIANPRDINGLVSTIRTSYFSMFSGVNTLYSALVNHPKITQVDWSYLQLSVAGGMSTQQKVADKWKEVTNCSIVEGYGLSETSPIITCNIPGKDEFSNGIGYPLPSTQVYLRTNEGLPAEVDEPGEILVKGPQVMSGYWCRPDETAQVMTDDGWFCTGDIGVMNSEGMFKIVDRSKDMILVSGFNVYPNEIELVLSQHPKVKEVAVIGIPFAQSGEAPMAVVVPFDASLSGEELKDFAKQKLTHYKLPRTFKFVDDLPKSNVGKILRRRVKELYNNGEL